MPDEWNLLRRDAKRDFRRLAIALILHRLILTGVAYAVQYLLVDYWWALSPHLTTDEIYDRLWNSGLSMIAASLAGLAVILLLLGSRLRRESPRERMHARQFLLTLIGINGLQLLTLFVTLPLERIIESMGYSLEEAAAASSEASVTVSMLLYAVLIAPLVEELIFRGAVLRWLEPWGRRFALVTSAVLFGLMHGNLVQLPVAIVFGLLFGYIAQRFSLRASIAAHAANNLFAELIGLLPEDWDLMWMLYFFVRLLCAAYVIYWCLTRWQTLAEAYRRQVTPPSAAWFLTSIPVLLLLFLYLEDTMQSAIPI